MKYNINDLIKAVSEEMPCGNDLTEETDYYILEELASEKEETQFSEAEVVDWGKVEKLSITLLNKSKDLWITHYFISSLFKQYKVKGIYDGIQLLNNIITQYWNNIYPLPDEDFEDPLLERVNILKTIFNRNSSLCKSLVDINISKSKLLGMFTYKDYLVATDKIKSEKIEHSHTKEIIIGAVKETDQNCIDELKSSLTGISDHLTGILEFFKSNGVDDRELSDSIENVLSTAHSIIADVDSIRTIKTDDLSETSAGELGEGLTNESVAKDYVNSTSIEGYSDIIKLIKLINEWYANNEPASPVPLFLNRAESLIGKDFISIINDVAESAAPEINNLLKVKSSQADNVSGGIAPGSPGQMMPSESLPQSYGSGENMQNLDQFPYAPNNNDYKY